MNQDDTGRRGSVEFGSIYDDGRRVGVEGVSVAVDQVDVRAAAEVGNELRMFLLSAEICRN